MIPTTPSANNVMLGRIRPWLVILLYFCPVQFVIGNVSSNIDPYKILGLTKDCTQDEIKKNYRTLCLQYHPDKNPQDKEKCERLFKQIQEANSLIGTAEDRAKHNSLTSFSRFTNSPSRYSNGSPSHHETATEKAFQQFFQQSQNHPSSRYSPHRSRAFYVNGINVSHLFQPKRTGNSNNPFDGINPFQNEESLSDPDTPRSTFLHKVTVPLHQLYTGTQRKEFILQGNLFETYMAAFRGGIAPQLACQSLLYALPLLIRANWLISLLGFLGTFHLSLPRPSRSLFYSKIKAGWKTGTKLKFESAEPGIDVVFILEEGKHARFEREGNDLKTSIQISKTKARKGCTLFIEPLGENEMPITVKLKRGDIIQKSQIVVVKGKGWPMLGGNAGDLKIQVTVVSDAKAERIKKKRTL